MDNNRPNEEIDDGYSTGATNLRMRRSPRTELRTVRHR